MFSFLLFSFSIERRWTQCGQLMCDFYASCTECLSQQYTYSICWKFAYANKQLNTTTAECFCFRHFPHTRMSLTPQRKGNKNDSKSACIIQNWTNCISSIQRQKALISFYFITRFLGRICVAADGTVRRHRYPPLLLQFTLHSRSVGFMCSLMHISCSFSISHKVISYFSCLFLDVLVYFACVFYDICVCAFLSQSLSLSFLSMPNNNQRANCTRRQQRQPYNRIKMRNELKWNDEIAIQLLLVALFLCVGGGIGPSWQNQILHCSVN